MTHLIWQFNGRRTWEKFCDFIELIIPHILVVRPQPCVLSDNPGIMQFYFLFFGQRIADPAHKFSDGFPLWFMLPPAETFQTAGLSNVLSFVLVCCPGLQPALWALCQLGHKSFSMFHVRCCQAAKKSDSRWDDNDVVTFNENLWFFISIFRWIIGTLKRMQTVYNH